MLEFPAEISWGNRLIYFCERIGAAISALVDGELDDGVLVKSPARDASPLDAPSIDEASLQAHIQSCTHCAAEKRRLERAAELARPSDTDPGPSPEVWSSIEAKLRGEGIIR